MTEIATGLSTAICKDGQTTVTANIPMNSKKFTGLTAGSARTDSANIGNIVDGTGVYVATVGGTADVITLTPSPAITAYAAGQTFRFIASGANTTNVTVAISGLAAKAITKNGTTALIAGDIPSGMMVEITYDGTEFVLGTVGAATAIPRTLIDAAGDLIIGTAADTASRLAIGTARQVLQVNTGATAPAWATPITLATEQAASGASVTFSSIPAGVRRITIMFRLVYNGSSTADILIQIGDSGGVETSGYSTVCGSIYGSTPLSTSNSSGWVLSPKAATDYINGALTLSLEDASDFTWVGHGVLSSIPDVGSVVSWSVSGSKALTAELDRVVITTVGGSDSFDSGSINISYE